MMGQPTNPFDPDISLNGQVFQAYLPKQFKAGLTSAPAPVNNACDVVNKGTLKEDTTPKPKDNKTNKMVHNQDPIKRHGGVFIFSKNYKHLDVFGVSVFLSGMIGMVFTSIYWTIPIVYADSEEKLKWNTFLLWFVVFNTVTNFILILMNRSAFDPSWSSNPVQYLPDPTWRKCLDCQHASPPRSHHCSICQKCILKRDHHCFFVGTCIGFYNQRYFLVYCFYVAFGSIYYFFVTWTYLGMEYTLAHSGAFYDYLLPVTLIQAIIGNVPGYFLGLIFLEYISLAAAIGSVAMFVGQMYLALVGLTTHEYSHGIVSFKSMKCMRNLRSVFGRYWLLNFFFPVPCFSSYGDGIDWPQQSKYI